MIRHDEVCLFADHELPIVIVSLLDHAIDFVGEGDRVELHAGDGAIGTSLLPVLVNSNIDGTGGLAALADGDIHIVETEGDIKLIEPVSFDATASTDPPSPTSPPSGPPIGIYFSRRKLTMPPPPLPALT